jgi:hypothetical protein
VNLSHECHLNPSFFRSARAYPWQKANMKKVASKVKQLSPCFTSVSCLAYCATSRAEATYSSATSDYFQRTTQCYIAEGIILPTRKSSYNPIRKRSRAKSVMLLMVQISPLKFRTVKVSMGGICSHVTA